MVVRVYSNGMTVLLRECATPLRSLSLDGDTSYTTHPNQITP